MSLPRVYGGLREYVPKTREDHFDGAVETVIYDYVDGNVPVLARMRQKRLAGYRAMGYAVGGEAR